MKRMLSTISIDFEFVVDSDYSTEEVSNQIQKEVIKYVDVALWNIGIEKYSGKICTGQFKDCKDDSLQQMEME